MKNLTNPRNSTYRLQQILQENLSTHRRLARDYGIELEVIDDLASDVRVSGNGAAQKELFDLLMQNAIRHSRASRIVFTVRQLLQSGSSLLLEFTLIDNGVKPRLNAHSFRYCRNLVQARDLIEKLGGKTEVISVPGLNTTFKFLLHYHTDRPAGRLVKARPQGRLGGRRILVAEDNEVNARVIEGILLRHGARPRLVANGKEAVEVLEAESFDLVLLDLQMPCMDGFRAANYIRKQLQSSMPVIGMTVGDPEGGRQTCLATGMDSFIRKPFSVPELLKTIRDVSRQS